MHRKENGTFGLLFTTWVRKSTKVRADELNNPHSTPMERRSLITSLFKGAATSSPFQVIWLGSLFPTLFPQIVVVAIAPLLCTGIRMQRATPVWDHSSQAIYTQDLRQEKRIPQSPLSSLVPQPRTLTVFLCYNNLRWLTESLGSWSPANSSERNFRRTGA